MIVQYINILVLYIFIDKWWKFFGCDVRNLQELAIQILSQTASFSGCECNWSVFERIQTKKKNRLEHQRPYDLVLFTTTYVCN